MRYFAVIGLVILACAMPAFAVNGPIGGPDPQYPRMQGDCPAGVTETGNPFVIAGMDRETPSTATPSSLVRTVRVSPDGALYVIMTSTGTAVISRPIGTPSTTATISSTARMMWAGVM